MEHTKEPWRLHEKHGEIVYTSEADDQSFGMWCPVDLTSETNMRRIVACVNACAGLPDAVVLHGLVPASRHSTVAHQRVCKRIFDNAHDKD